MCTNTASLFTLTVNTCGTTADSLVRQHCGTRIFAVTHVVLHNDICERYILHMLAPRHWRIMNCLRLQHIVLFFSMCDVRFCGWNLFGHHVFLPAIAIMSSQQIRILPLLTCIGAETLAYMRAFLCVQPDTRFCMPLSIRSWKHAHPL